MKPSLGLTREQFALGSCLIFYCIVVFLAKLPLLDWLMRLWGRLPGRKQTGVNIAGVNLSDDARVRHTHIVGATGSGKTVLIEQLLSEDIRTGKGCLVIDPKGDRELYERVKWECERLGRAHDLHFLSATFPNESGQWNPCELGNVSELQSKFFNSAIYSEPHYAKWCEKALLQAFNELTHSYPKGFGINSLVKNLEMFCESQKSRDEKVEGLFLDLFNLSSGEWKPIIGCEKSADGPGRPPISLLEITKKNQILFVDLPTEAKKVQSARIGRLLTQELMLISGLRKIYPGIQSDKPFSVYIDEFDAFATESFATFLNKARSSGFMIHIAHQTLSDLNRISQDFAGQILGNSNIRFIFRQDDPDDAERWSRFLGTRTVVKRTFQTVNGSETGLSSNRATQEFVIAPDQIKRLLVGEAILSIKTDDITRKIKTKFKPAKIRVGAKRSEEGSPTVRGLGDEDENAQREEKEVPNEIVSQKVQTESRIVSENFNGETA